MIHLAKRLGRLAVLGFFLWLTACASVTPKQAPDRQAHRLPVPFVKQTQAHCGPASLASLLDYYKREADVETLIRQVYLPGRRGSLSVEMKAAARRHGLLPYPVTPTLDALLQELDADNPVLVLQNLGFNWWPQWHYALVVGYEDSGRQLLLHSGENAYYSISAGTFMRTWARADHWGLVAVPLTRLPATAQALPYLQVLEILRQHSSVSDTEVGLALQAAVARWPESAAAAFVWANYLLQRGRYEEASRAFIRGLARKPESPLAWNNLAHSLSGQGCYYESQQAIGRAIGLAPSDKRIQHSAVELAGMEPVDGEGCPELP